MFQEMQETVDSMSTMAAEMCRDLDIDLDTLLENLESESWWDMNNDRE
jgi:hypothetical protein